MAPSTSPRKRLSAEFDPTDLPIRNTRRKPSPPSSATTSTAVSTPNDSTEATEYSSDSDSSTLSASSPEPSSSSEDDDSSDADSDADSNEAEGDVTSLPLPPDFQARQQIYRETTATLSADRVPLRERLQAFLPQIAAANAKLEEERTMGRLGESVFDAVKDGEEEDGKQYVEMDLGLGVLEEKDPNKMDDSEEEDEVEEDQHMAGADDNTSPKRKEKDVMGKLLGQKGRKPGGGGIEEVADQ